MKVYSYFDRAYINISGTDNKIIEIDHKKNFMDLIRAVAVANPFGDGDEQLYNNITHEVYEGRTKSYIVKKTKTYILGITQRYSAEENMATYVSLRQLKYLIKAFEREKKRISCYSLIYVYIIYTLIKNKSPEARDCIIYLNALYKCVEKYFISNPDDQLAAFFSDCYKPILEAIQNESEVLDVKRLPSVPRNNPNDDVD